MMKKSNILKALVVLTGGAVAAKMVYNKLKPQKEEVYEDIFEEEELFAAPVKESGEIQVVVAEHKVIGLSGDFKPLNYKLIADSLEIDLTDAVITENTSLKLFTLASSVRVKVPAGVNVVLKSKTFLGSTVNEAAECGEEAPVLAIESTNVMSALNIQ